MLSLTILVNIFEGLEFDTNVPFLMLYLLFD